MMENFPIDSFSLMAFANIEAVKILNNKDFFDDVIAKTTLIGLVISIKHINGVIFSI